MLKFTQTRNPPPFIEPEDSLPFSQNPTTGSYPEPDESSPQFLHYFFKTHTDIIFPATPWSSEWSFSFTVKYY